ncbi:MAG: LamG-like jellyroll fold domain-containing protein [Sediminicola sp.]
MKNITNSFFGISSLLLLWSCDQGIDSITQVDPGSDASSPVVSINYPTEGMAIKVLETLTSITLDFEVTDDIEVASVAVMIDGNTIKTYSDFKDYRRLVVDDLTYDGLADGDHTLSITASDLDGKTTTSSVSFVKEPAYVPLFEGEQLYMPFDGTYTDLISFQTATEVGDPTFEGEGIVGSNSYKGAAESYLTFPAEGLLTTEFSGAFWYRVDADPSNAGILVIGANADDRLQGIRLFREGDASQQRIKLNVGTGNGEVWNDGGLLDVTAGQWVHIAFSISPTSNSIYFNGVEIRSSVMTGPIDWTGCETITIGSGGDTFGYWGHLSDFSALDELRLFNKSITQADVQNMIDITNPYIPEYAGETFYMDFDGDLMETASGSEAEMVGETTFAGESVDGSNAFAGAADSYITFPLEGIFGTSFSAAFWYKVNPEPVNAGIIVVGDDSDDRFQGFRLFREGTATEQRIKLNVGTGSGESWNDGGVLDATTGEWVHIAFTVSPTENILYFNGEAQLTSAMANAVDWTGCSEITIGAGGDTFSYWNHLSDYSFVDELRFFEKTLTQEEIQQIMNDDL